MTTAKKQPARNLIFVQNRDVKQTAADIGVPYAHLGNCLNGRVSPSGIVRDKLPALLGVTLEECFDAELLAQRYSSVPAARSPRKTQAVRNDA